MLEKPNSFIPHGDAGRGIVRVRRAIGRLRFG